MIWWYWAAFGLLLVAIELMTPGGFYFIFFGAAALIVGALTLADLSGPEWMQWLLFSVFAIVSLLLFRRPLVQRMRGGGEGAEPMDSLVGEVATAATQIPPGAVAKVELRGTTWTARNVGAAAIGAGQRCRVQRVDGLTLEIRVE